MLSNTLVAFIVMAPVPASRSMLPLPAAELAVRTSASDAKLKACAARTLTLPLVLKLSALTVMSVPAPRVCKSTLPVPWLLTATPSASVLPSVRLPAVVRSTMAPLPALVRRSDWLSCTVVLAPAVSMRPTLTLTLSTVTALASSTNTPPLPATPVTVLTEMSSASLELPTPPAAPACTSRPIALTSTSGAALSASPSMMEVPALSATKAADASMLPSTISRPASSMTLPVAVMLPCVRPTPEPVLMPMSCPASTSKVLAANTSPRRFTSRLAVKDAPPVPARTTLPALRVMEPALTPMYTVAALPLCTRPRLEAFRVELARRLWSPPATTAAPKVIKSPTRVTSLPASVAAVTEIELAEALMSLPALVAAETRMEPSTRLADAVMSPLRASVLAATVMFLAVKLMCWATSTTAEIVKSVSARMDKEPLFVTSMPL